MKAPTIAQAASLTAADVHDLARAWRRSGVSGAPDGVFVVDRAMGSRDTWWHGEKELVALRDALTPMLATVGSSSERYGAFLAVVYAWVAVRFVDVMSPEQAEEMYGPWKSVASLVQSRCDSERVRAFSARSLRASLGSVSGLDSVGGV